jgi:alkaline phosphatase
MAKAHGLSAGAVTTTRITHATPAGTYAHTAYRDWEGDGDMPTEAMARPAARTSPASWSRRARLRLDVAMGGGRSRFLPEAKDGKRADGRDLTAEWLKTPARPM